MSAGEGSGPGGGLHGMPAGLLFGMTQPGGGLPPMMNPPPGLPPGLPPPGLPPPGLPPDFDFSALAQLQGLPPGGLSGLPGGLPGLGGFGGLPGLPGGLPGDPGSNPMLQALLAQAPAGPSAADTAALMAQAQQQQPPQQHPALRLLSAVARHPYERHASVAALHLQLMDWKLLPNACKLQASLRLLSGDAVWGQLEAGLGPLTAQRGAAGCQAGAPWQAFDVRQSLHNGGCL